MEGGAPVAVSEAPESPFDDTQLAALVALGVERTYARHTVLLQEGDRGHQLYLVRSGRLKVFLADRDGREVIVVRCSVPCDHVPVRSWPLFRAREVMPVLIKSLRQELRS